MKTTRASIALKHDVPEDIAGTKETNNAFPVMCHQMFVI